MEQYLKQQIEKYFWEQYANKILCTGYEIKQTKLPRKLKKKMKKNKQICMDVTVYQSIPYIQYEITIPSEE